jgi:hypothetical protein
MSCVLRPYGPNVRSHNNARSHNKPPNDFIPNDFIFRKLPTPGRAVAMIRALTSDCQRLRRHGRSVLQAQPMSLAMSLN